MNKQQINDRIKYIKMELAHSHYHDGWVINGLTDELNKLTKKLSLKT
tara:strand:+ start:491 stop:631 length:141 start_codon:yes stop_codon:yes gene_type:complete